MKKILIGALCVGIVGVIWLGIHSKDRAADTSRAPEKTQSTKVGIVSTKLSKKFSFGYTFTASLPALASSESESARQLFDAAVKKVLAEELGNTDEKTARQNFELPKEMPPRETSTGISFVVVGQGSRAVSILFRVDEYDGGAHPISWFHVLTYDFQDKRAVVLKDMVKDEADILAALSIESSRVLKEKLQTGPDAIGVDFIEEGTKPTEENFANMVFGPDGVIIHFSPYQVAPYVAGPQEVRVGYEKLLPYLNDYGTIIVHSIQQ